MRRALVLGAGGFIGSHMVSRLKSEGYNVTGVDLKHPEFGRSNADTFIIGDLRSKEFVDSVISQVDLTEVYQYAADMGGAGFVFSGDNDAAIMHNSALVNLNVLERIKELAIDRKANKVKIFYSGSACMYPQHNQRDPSNPNLEESSAYPADPDSEYGWEKLFSERMYLAYSRNYGIPVAIGRFHNIYGPEGTWSGGREKVPAAICRKIASLPATGGQIEVWGDGNQTRSFLYIEDCIEATRRLMASNFQDPINIGSEEMVSVNTLVDLVAEIAGKKVTKKHVLDAPVGVRGRNSSNQLIRRVLNWEYVHSLRSGLEKTYSWVASQVENADK
jgi:nucleoside-diphosphate-sugar epimerase